MATLRLKPGGSARCPEGVMTIDWRVEGASTGGVLVELVQPGGAAAVAVSTTGAAQLLVAALPHAVELRARPTSGSTFANGVVVSAQLTLQVGGAAAGTYLLPAADVSGTPSLALLTMTPHEGLFQLDVPADVGRTSPTAHPTASRRPAARAGGQPATPLVQGATLEGLAQEAAYAARRRAGGSRIPDADRTEVHLAVDRSASFLPLVRQGSGQALLELVLGVNDVVGTTPDVTLWTLGAPPSRLRTLLSGSTAAGLWAAEMGDVATTSGTRLAPLVQEHALAAGSSRTVVVVTDGPPADLPNLVTALRQARTAGSTVRWHVLALACSTDDAQVAREPWRDELAALQPLVRESLLTCSSLTPDEVEGWLPELLADPDALERVVDALPFWGAA